MQLAKRHIKAICRPLIGHGENNKTDENVDKVPFFIRVCFLLCSSFR